jgi:hypothetical protein
MEHSEREAVVIQVIEFHYDYHFHFHLSATFEVTVNQLSTPFLFLFNLIY